MFLLKKFKRNKTSTTKHVPIGSNQPRKIFPRLSIKSIETINPDMPLPKTESIMIQSARVRSSSIDDFQFHESFHSFPDLSVLSSKRSSNTRQHGNTSSDSESYMPTFSLDAPPIIHTIGSHIKPPSVSMTVKLKSKLTPSPNPSPHSPSPLMMLNEKTFSNFENIESSTSTFTEDSESSPFERVQAQVTQSSTGQSEVLNNMFEEIVPICDKMIVFKATPKEVYPNYPHVVIKVQRLTQDEKNFRHRSIREASILSMLSNRDVLNARGYPYIVKYIDELVDKSLNMHILVLEYCAHGTLLELIQTYGNTLPYNVLRSLAFQVTKGVEYIHMMGVVHRDLKLENVLLSYNHETAEIIVKICDFGYSSHFMPSSTDSESMGSPHYCAPEVFFNIQKNPVLVDIWALGVIIYGIFEGAFPFSGREVASGVAIACEFFRSYELGFTNISFFKSKNIPYFVSLVRGMLSFRPEERPSASQIILNNFFNQKMEKLSISFLK